VTRFALSVWANNIGQVYAQYINAFLEMPCALLEHRQKSSAEPESKPAFDISQYCESRLDNTVRDLIKGGGGFAQEHGPARHVPILPDITHKLDDFLVTSNFENINWTDHRIRWTVRADNAPLNRGEIAINGIEITDYGYDEEY
jgi:hypothetical protein